MPKNKIIYWTPRILAIILLAFISTLSLDVFSSQLKWYEYFGALLMHLIPSLILAAAIALSWKYELIGGVIFIALGIIYILMAKGFPISVYLIMTGIPLIIGVLFILNHFVKKKR
ncbi:MAG TPA: hypothetical protein VJJ21_04460 [Candidatus Nanoarchaeia archaeon]|nr:hypothetical protein [Candidatus Nanoarchaeia archaeon]